jgi:hypothetical protein
VVTRYYSQQLVLYQVVGLLITAKLHIALATLRPWAVIKSVVDNVHIYHKQIHVLVRMDATPQTCQHLLNPRKLINLLSSCLDLTRSSSVHHMAACFLSYTLVCTIKLDNMLLQLQSGRRITTPDVTWRLCSICQLRRRTVPLCKIWGFHGGVHEEWRLLGCYVVWLL